MLLLRPLSTLQICQNAHTPDQEQLLCCIPFATLICLATVIVQICLALRKVSTDHYKRDHLT